MRPAILGAADVAPAESVHGTMWNKPEKYTGAIETNARLMSDRAPIEQLVLYEYGGG